MTRSKGRRKPPFCCVAMIWAGMLIARVACAGEAGAFAVVESYSYSEPVSIRSGLGDWDGQFYGGDRQWSHNWVEAGYHFGRWSISALYRRDIWLDTNNDTAELYYLATNKLPLEPGREYDLALSGYSFSGLGVRAAWISHASDRLTVSWGFSVLNADDLLDGQFTGTATALADNDYEYEAEVDYVYSKDVLFNRPVARPDGMGASLDVSASYKPMSGVTLSATVVDLLGAIWWQEAPFTRATAFSDRRGYDENGYIIVEPAISGVEGIHKHYTQRLLPRAMLGIQAIVTPAWQAQAEYRYQYEQGLLGLGASRSIGTNKIGVLIWPSVRAVGLNVEWGRVGFSLALDDVNLDDARTLWLGLTVR